jgi:hypothetical protein
VDEVRYPPGVLDSVGEKQDSYFNHADTWDIHDNEKSVVMEDLQGLHLVEIVLMSTSSV